MWAEQKRGMAFADRSARMCIGDVGFRWRASAGPASAQRGESQRDDCADGYQKMSKHDRCASWILLVASRRGARPSAAPAAQHQRVESGKWTRASASDLLFPSREHGTQTLGNVGPLISEILPFAHVLAQVENEYMVASTTSFQSPLRIARMLRLPTSVRQ
jgi:hypothetical protein